MNILGEITLLPHLPAELARLDELARNLFWTWEGSARELFRRLDPELWEETLHNPTLMLRTVPQARLDAAARDEAYLEAYRAVLARLDEYLAPGPAGGQEGGDLYAYFCAEFGWHESIPIYSGGLGVLAGDHTKAASDLKVPLVAVGLWYPQGYFHQRVAADGRQEAIYLEHAPEEMPLRRAVDREGREARVSVEIFGREVRVAAWQVRVGRNEVYLLDVDLEENRPEDRELLARLYGGDQRTRIAQEMLLGIGGVRLLRALGYSPTVWHMNEGHSAFLVLERSRELVQSGLTFAEAWQAVVAGTVFTIHTPVAAGNDAFAFDLVRECFGDFPNSLGLTWEEFEAIGQADHGWGPVFSMPALALRGSTGRNGVSELHGDTSRRIWDPLWPGVPPEEVPISHVTNGVHLSTWMAPEIRALLDLALPRDWQARLEDDRMWDAVEEIDEAELWRARQEMKARNVRFLRRRVHRQRTRQEAGSAALHEAEELFDPSILTIGFARRFATYKRATLIFRDLDRLAALLGSADRPVQLVFAGKAHPADQPGQTLIRQIHNLSNDPRFAGRIIFIEDYDMAVGRALTSGVDVWLNNPRRPLEASGTSGEKAAMNGVLNLSVLDGWWPEGFDGTNGWAFGWPRRHTDPELADAADAEELYELLENQVVPLYYDRDERGVPREWVRRSRAAIRTIAPRFNARRMVGDYVRGFYEPAAARSRRLAERDFEPAKRLAAWLERVRTVWPEVRLEAAKTGTRTARVGEELTIEATLDPAGLSPDEIRVELVCSPETDQLRRGLWVVPMTCVGKLPDGRLRYRAEFRPEGSGRMVYGARAYAVHELLAEPFDAGAITWA